MKLISSLFFEIFFNRRTDGRTDTQSESKKPRHEHDAKHGWGLINITSVCLFSFSHFQLKWGDFVHLFISLGGGGGGLCPGYFVRGVGIMSHTRFYTGQCLYPQQPAGASVAPILWVSCWVWWLERLRTHSSRRVELVIYTI